MRTVFGLHLTMITCGKQTVLVATQLTKEQKCARRDITSVRLRRKWRHGTARATDKNDPQDKTKRPLYRVCVAGVDDVQLHYTIRRAIQWVGTEFVAAQLTMQQQKRHDAVCYERFDRTTTAVNVPPVATNTVHRHLLELCLFCRARAVEPTSVFCVMRRWSL
jgi:hypothetical protein